MAGAKIRSAIAPLCEALEARCMLSGDLRYQLGGSTEVVPNGNVTVDGQGTHALDLYGADGVDTLSFGANYVDYESGSQSGRITFQDVPVVRLHLGSGADQISVGGGAVTLAGTTVAADALLQIDGGAVKVGDDGKGALAVDGAVEQSGGSVLAGNLDGSGSLTVDGTGVMTVDRVRLDALTLDDAGVLHVRPSGTIRYGAGVTAGTCVLDDLSIAADSTFDLGNNHLVYTGSPTSFPTIKGWVAAAYDYGAWDTPGLGSSYVAGSGDWTGRAVGIDTAQGLNVSSFGGVAVSQDPDTLLVRYTLNGDANFDGAVNFDDMVVVAQNYEAPGSYSWHQGDFTFDGLVNFGDLIAVAQNYELNINTPPNVSTQPWLRALALSNVAAINQPFEIALGYHNVAGLTNLKVKVDWGDNSPIVTYNGLPTSVQHAYASTGQYPITVKLYQGTLLKATVSVQYASTYGTRGDGLVVTDAGGDDRPTAAATDADGNLLVAAQVDPYGPLAVMRYLPDGTLDPDFATASNHRAIIDFGMLGSEHYKAYAAAVVTDSAGNIYLVGDVYTSSGAYDFAIARLTPDGALDTGFGDQGVKILDFGSGVHARANALSIDSSSGNLLMAGFAGNSMALALLDSGGDVINSFGPNGNGRLTVALGVADGVAYTAKFDSAGRVVVAGRSGDDMAVARFLADGTPDSNFGDNADGSIVFDVGESDYIYDLAFDNVQNRIVLCGEANGLITVMRLLGDGSGLDPSFGESYEGAGDGLGYINDPRRTASLAYRVAIDSQGRIVVGGNTLVARYLPNGLADTSFGAGGLYQWQQALDGVERVQALGMFSNDDAVTVLGRTIPTGQTWGDVAIMRLAPDYRVRVVNPPTVATAATATYLTDTTFALSVLGADDDGEASLRYTWSVLEAPDGAASPTFSPNGTNAAKDATVTFATAGAYTLRVVIDNGPGSTISDVNVMVDQTLSSIVVSPASTTTNAGASVQFVAVAKDQFGDTMVPPQPFYWSVDNGTITQGGLFTAAASGDSATVTVQIGSVTGLATVSNVPSVPTVLHLPMDESSGTTAADVSGHGLNATLHGATFVPADRATVGHALSFDGVDDYATIVDAAGASLLDNTDQLTIAMWVRVDPAAASGLARGLIVKRVDYAHQNAFTLALGPDGKPYVDFDHYQYRLSGSTALTPGQWYHLAAAFDGTASSSQRIKLYVDGDLDATGSGPTTIHDYASNGVYLGALGPNQSPFQGRLDDVRVYREALSEDQVQALTRVPLAPVLFTTAPVDYAFGQVRLSWQDPDPMVQGYWIERRDGYTGDWSRLVTLGASTTQYVDTTAQPGAMYFYRVYASNAAGDSEPTTAQLSTPSLPVRLGLDNVASDGTATLKVDVTSGYESWIKGYAVDWGDGTPATIIAGTPPATLTHRYASSDTFTPVLKFVDATANWVTPYTAHLNYDATLGTVGKQTTPLPGLGAAGALPWSGAAAVTPLPLDDGKYLVAGHNASGGFAVARYTADGVLDTTFGDPTYGGQHTGWSLVGLNGPVHYNDSPTGGGGDDPIYSATSMAVESDGTIVVAGDVLIEGIAHLAMVRFTGAGLPFDDDDDKMVVGRTGHANAVAVDEASNRLYVAGYHSRDVLLAAYNLDTLDPVTFGTGGSVAVDLGSGTQDFAYGVTVQGDGKIVVAGRREFEAAVLRFTTGGQLDETFNYDDATDGRGKYVQDLSDGPEFEGFYHITIDPQTDNLLLVGEADAHVALLRLASDGTPDTNFGNQGVVLTSLGRNYLGWTALLQDDGKIVVGGMVNRAPASFLVARYSSTGQLDATFGEGGLVETTLSQATTYSLVLNLVKQGDTITAVGTARSANFDDFALVRMRDTIDLTVGELGEQTVLTATPNRTAGAIDLAWTHTGTATLGGFRVERDDGQGFGTLVTLNNPVASGFSDDTVEAGTTYTYRVVPFYLTTDYAPSNEVETTLHLSGQGSISGYAFHDRNQNHVWDQDLIRGDAPHVIFVMDVSGSTNAVFDSIDTNVGKWDAWNNDANQISDAEIAGFAALNQQIINLGLSSKATVSAVAFASDAVVLDLDQDVAGQQATGRADALVDGDYRVVNALRHAVGVDPERDKYAVWARDGTDFQAPLQRVIQLLQAAHTPYGQANIVFLSDGMAGSGFEDEIAALKTQFGAHIRAFGVGSDADLSQLKTMDPQAFSFTTADELVNAFQGLGVGEDPETGLAGQRLFIDEDGDEEWDSASEPSTLTDADGRYTFTGLAAGRYSICVVDDAAWKQTAPQPALNDDRLPIDAVLNSETDQLDDRNFGLVEDVDAPGPFSVTITPSTGLERAPLVVTVSGASDQDGDPSTSVLYSYDFNDNGSFLDSGDVYRSPHSTATFVVDDGPDAAHTVRVRVHDAYGNYRDQNATVSVLDEAPRVQILGLPDEIDLSQIQPDDAGGAPVLHVGSTVVDASTADTVEGFDYAWSVFRNDETTAMDLGNVPTDQALLAFSPPEAATYHVFLTVTEKVDGGQTTVSKTVVVSDACPYIDDYSVDMDDPTHRTATLALTARDDGGEPNLVYYWDVDDPDNVVGFDQLNGTNAAKQITVAFRAAGTYAFTGYAVDKDGNFAVQDITVEVQQTVSAVRITPSMVALSWGGTQQMSYEALDQFGAPYGTATGTASWTLLGTAVGSIDSSGLYTAPETAGSSTQTTIQLQIGGRTAQAPVFLSNVGTLPIVGAAADGTVVEGQDFGSEQSDVGGLAIFCDPQSGTQLGEYQATIDWDVNDNGAQGPESATVVAYTIPGVGAGWTVVAASDHHYSDPGSYTFEVTLTHTDNGSPPAVRSQSVQSTIEVLTAAVQVQAAQVVAASGASQQFTLGYVASQDLTDPSSAFSGTILWEAGGASGPVTIQPLIVDGQNVPGVFEIVGTHTYSAEGSKTATLSISKGGTVVASVLVSVTVLPQALDKPEIEGSFVVSVSQLGIQWTKVDQADGYIVWATNTKTGVRREIDGVRGTPADHPEHSLYYVDQFLPSDTRFIYTVQWVKFVDIGGQTVALVSPESDPIVARTPPLKSVAAPAVAARHHVMLDANTPDARQGVELSWIASTKVGGYQVYRKILDGGVLKWQNLLNGKVTPVAAPDWESTLSGDGTTFQNLIYLSDNANTSTLTWDDDFTAQHSPGGFAPGVDSIDYAIVAFDTDADQLVFAPSFITVDKDTAAPSVPTGVAAHSYPQGIQITWSDRPDSDVDWAGWNVYRMDPGSTVWRKLNLKLITDTTGFNDLTARPGLPTIPVALEYQYKITAVDTLGNESAGALMNRRRSTHGEPPPPAYLTASPATGGGVQLDWPEVTPPRDAGWANDDLRGYDVQWLDGQNQWQPLRGASDANGAQNTYTHSSGSSTSRYRVRTVDKDGDYSDWVEVTGIGPNAPSGSVQRTDATTIHVTWSPQHDDNLPDAVKYDVYRAVGGSGAFVLHPDYPQGTTDTSLTDLGLDALRTYRYRIVAVDSAGHRSAPLTLVASPLDVTQSQPPVVELVNPAADGGTVVVSKDLVVRGLVYDPNGDEDLDGWTLTLQPVDGPSVPVTLASGSSDVDEGTALATIQPTGLQNGLYRLVLSAQDAQHTVQTTVFIRIQCDLKLGDLVLPFADLSIDVPGGQPIQLTRTYDSKLTNVKGEFGYGWHLDALQPAVSTTATPSTRDGQSGQTTLRYGDLVYVTLPDGMKQTFQFIPMPSEYVQASGTLGAYDPMSPFYVGSSYKAQFVCVDGSGAMLTLKSPEWLKYDRDHQEFVGAESGEPFSLALVGETYSVETADGSTYTFDAASGKLQSSLDANQNVTDYTADLATHDGNLRLIQSGNAMAYIHYGTNGLVDWVGSDQTNPTRQVHFEYDGQGRLSTVTDQSGKVTTYQYADPDNNPGDPDNRYLLTGITDANDTKVVSVTYDGAGRVLTLTDLRNQDTDLGYSGYDGQTANSGVTNPDQTEVEQIQDEHGAVIREIRKVIEGSSVKYVVTVHQFVYADELSNAQLQDMVLHQKSSYGGLLSQTDYQPFEIADPDDPDDIAGKRYVASPEEMGAAVASRMTFYGFDEDDPNNYNLGKPCTQTALAPDGVTLLTTTFADYNAQGKPQTTTDPYGNVTTNQYDACGNLIATTNALQETTYYSYTAAQYADPQNPTNTQSFYSYHDETIGQYQGLPNGLQLESWIVRDGNVIVLTKNVYGVEQAPDSDHGNNVWYDGSVLSTTQWGRLQFTENPQTGLRTQYEYAPSGQVKETKRSWLDAAAPGGRQSVSDGTTTFDEQGRTKTTTDANGQSTSTFYDSHGQVLVTVDAFGGKTVNGYDAQGRLVRTLYPDGTETRTVYDQATGRTLWTSDRFASNATATVTIDTQAWTATVVWGTTTGSSEPTFIATHTLYDNLGRTIGSERFKDVSIPLVADIVSGTFTTIPDDDPAPSSGDRLSDTATLYNDKGQVKESISATGLRTGTIYYPNGQPHYSGIVATAPTSNQAQLVFERDSSGNPTSYLVDYTTTGQDLYNVNTITLGGTIVEGDILTLTIRDQTGRPTTADDESGGTLDRVSVTVGTGDDRTTLLTSLAASINAKATTSLFHEVEASVVSETLVLLARAGQSQSYLIFTAVSQTGSTPTKARIGTSSTVRSSWTQDANSHSTISISDNLGRSTKTLFDDGSFTEALSGVNGALANADRSDVDTPAGLTVPLGGRHEIKIAQRKSGETPVATHYLYDAAGRLTDVYLPEVTDATDDVERWPHWHYDYDANGNQISQTDPRGTLTTDVDHDYETTFAYDSRGRRIGRTLPMSQSESWAYDARGRVRTHVDFKGQTTADVYDDAPSAGGRVAAEYRFAAGATVFDEDGVLQTANAAEHTEYVYDDDPSVPSAQRLRLGRQVEVRDYVASSATVKTQHYRYDPITGQVSQIDSLEGATERGSVHHEYDQTTGLLIETWTGATAATGHSSATTSTLYGYDDQGRLKSVSSAVVDGQTQLTTGTVLHTRYDALGTPLNEETQYPTTLYVYDPAGNLQDVLMPNGMNTHYTYDALNRLTVENVTLDDPATTTAVETVPVADFDYNFYDSSAAEELKRRLMIQSDGQRGGVLETRYDGGEVFSQVAVDYVYDADGRLKGETRDTNNDGQDGDDYVASYFYDLNGNRLQKVFNSATISDKEKINYAYDANDQLTGETHYVANDPDGLINDLASTVGYTYDQNGSMTQKATTEGSSTTHERYHWDLRNRLDVYDAAGDDLDLNNTTGETTPNSTGPGDVVAYGYDALGVRDAKTTNGQTVHYVIDAANPTGYAKAIEEWSPSSSNPTRSYTLGFGVIAQAGADAAPLYFMIDGHGSTCGLFDTQGRAIERYDYTAFGEALNFVHIAYDEQGVPHETSILVDQAATNWLFGGDGIRDVASGLTYHIKRWRREQTFLSRDPNESNGADPMALHKYLYAGANPVIYIDPSGLDFSLGTLLTTVGTLARIGAGMLFGVSGAWNLAMAGVSVQRAYAASTEGSSTASLQIIGLMTLSIVQAYTGISNIQMANALLFGAPNPVKLPPNGLATLRAAIVGGGSNTVLIGQAVIALCPALAATIANAAGLFIAANTLFSTNFGNGVSSNPGGFASQAQLQDHFARHGSDFGATTAAEYELQANSFLNGSRAPGVLEKTRANGDIIRYNPATEEFGVVRTDGTIRTYYKPNPAMHGKPTNLDYFNAQ